MTQYTNMITLLAAGSTTQAAPTLTSATAGVALPFQCDQVAILVRTTAGSATMTVIAHLWGYCEQTGFWYKVGQLNGGNAIAETTADGINYAELVVGLRCFDRLAIELGTLGGTATAVAVEGICVRCEPSSR